MRKRASLDKREKETPKVIKGVMSTFVSSSNDEINKNDTKNKPKKVLDKSQETKEKSNTNSTENVKSYNTNVNTGNITNNETNNKTERVTNDVTKIVTNKIPKIIHVKSIRIGNRTLESTYSTEKSTTRCAYHLRKDTIEKIEVCSKLSGLKKAALIVISKPPLMFKILYNYQARILYDFFRKLDALQIFCGK